MKTPIAVLILASFLITGSIGPMPVTYAQDEFHLPPPGVMVRLSPPLDPPILKGLKIHPDDPFRFDFILDKGESELSDDQLKEESSKLIKYFLASLTIPEKNLWVNLSPYEKDRIIPGSFGLTEMGRDLLAEDYMLKQITASLIYPEDEIGRKFWKRIYQAAARKFGSTNIPVNTFNKVWIVPEKAVVYENSTAGTAYVVESKLKVMLEQDYLALSKSVSKPDVNALGSEVVREIIIPELTKEVNEDKNFAKLRQVYNSLILATWYKKKIKESILAQVYEDKNKVKGVGYSSRVNDIEFIYQRYVQAFKKGVYNYIKEEQDPMTQDMIPRKYFSGGVAFGPDGSNFSGIDGAFKEATRSQTRTAIEETDNDRAMQVEVKVSVSANSAMRTGQDEEIDQGRRRFSAFAAGLFAVVLAPAITFGQEAKPSVAQQLSKSVFESAKSHGSIRDEIRDDLVGLFVSNDEGREKSFERLSLASPHEKEVIARVIVDVMNSLDRNIYYPQARKLLLSFKDLPQSAEFNDAHLISGFFKSFNYAEGYTDPKDLKSGIELLPPWLKEKKREGVFEVITDNWLSNRDNDRNRLAKSLTNPLDQLLPYEIRQQWATVVQDLFKRGKIVEYQEFRIFRALHSDHPQVLQKEWFNTTSLSDQEARFFDLFINSGIYGSEEEFRGKQQNLVIEAEKLFRTEYASTQHQAWLEKLQVLNYKASTYSTVHYLAALVIAQDKMGNHFKRSGVNITFKQMRDLSLEILTNARVIIDENSTGDLDFGTDTFQRMKNADFLDFYFLLFHELFHNYHDFWGKDSGVDLFSTARFNTRISTITEFLADLMAIFIATELGLDAKRLAGDFRHVDDYSIRGAMFKELFGNFPAPRKSAAYVISLGEYLGRGVWGFLSNINQIIVPPKIIVTEHVAARRLVKEILSNPKANEIIPVIIDKAFDIITEETLKIKTKGENAPWELSWEDFQKEIKAVSSDRAMISTAPFVEAVRQVVAHEIPSNNIGAIVTPAGRRAVLSKEAELMAALASEETFPILDDMKIPIVAEEEGHLLQQLFAKLAGESFLEVHQELLKALRDQDIPEDRARNIIQLVFNGQIDNAHTLTLLERKKVYEAIFVKARIWKTSNNPMEPLGNFLSLSGAMKEKYFGVHGNPEVEIFFGEDKTDFGNEVVRQKEIASGYPMSESGRRAVVQEYRQDGGVNLPYRKKGGALAYKIVINLGVDGFGKVLSTVFHEMGHNILSGLSSHEAVTNERSFIHEGVAESFSIFSLRELAKQYDNHPAFLTLVTRRQARVMKEKIRQPEYRYGYVFMEAVMAKEGMGNFHSDVVPQIVQIIEGRSTVESLSKNVFDTAQITEKTGKIQEVKRIGYGGPGGIDLTPANMNLQTQNAGAGIKLHMDPAMLQRLRNAPGFVPVIINIQPMKNIEIFLGLEDGKDNLIHS